MSDSGTARSRGSFTSGPRTFNGWTIGACGNYLSGGDNRIGLIGCGTWGRNIKRVLEELGQQVVVYDPAHPDSLSSPHQLVKISDGVVIATPPDTHAHYANLALEYDRPFFVEKPLALDVIDAAFIRFAAFLTDTQGAVGHIGLFADDYPKAYSKLRAHKVTSNPGYHGISAWWDIGVHDVAIAVDQWGRPDRVEANMDFETYDVRLYWEGRIAELSGVRNGTGKEWRFQFDGDDWTPYESTTEPLYREMEWWLNGGANLDSALIVVETLVRATRTNEANGEAH